MSDILDGINLINMKTKFHLKYILIFLFSISPLNKVYSEEYLKQNDQLETNSIYIESDIQFTDSQSGVFTAKGNVNINFPLKNIFAKSDHLKYYNTDKTLLLKGNVTLIREGINTLNANQVVYSLEDDKLLTDSKNQYPSKLTIFLQNQQFRND